MEQIHSDYVYSLLVAKPKVWQFKCTYKKLQ